MHLLCREATTDISQGHCPWSVPEHITSRGDGGIVAFCWVLCHWLLPAIFKIILFR
jgi:hypothetical protein